MTPWIVAFQAPLSMGVCRQEYCSGLLFPPPRDIPDPGIEHASDRQVVFFFFLQLHFIFLIYIYIFFPIIFISWRRQAGSLALVPPGKPFPFNIQDQIKSPNCKNLLKRFCINVFCHCTERNRDLCFTDTLFLKKISHFTSIRL